MQKLLIHEKKSSGSAAAENEALLQSPLTPSKKRDFEASNAMAGSDLKSNRKLSELKLNASSFLNEDEPSLFSKKRKLKDLISN